MNHTPGGLHIAIIMDGNGRWALARGRPRIYGHRAGAKAVRRTVEAARRLGVNTLTLYAFSADNWARPPREVAALMRLLLVYLHAETERCIEHGIRLSVIGRRDRLDPGVRQAIEAAEAATRGGRDMLLRVAVDYSARDSILRAAALHAGGGEPSREAFGELLAQANHESAPAPDVDLLIRTGGEQRISDFLLWEIAYAELVFSTRMWPEFREADLEDALREFQGRQRRFGRIDEGRGAAERQREPLQVPRAAAR